MSTLNKAKLQFKIRFSSYELAKKNTEHITTCNSYKTEISARTTQIEQCRNPIVNFPI